MRMPSIGRLIGNMGGLLLVSLFAQPATAQTDRGPLDFSFSMAPWSAPSSGGAIAQDEPGDGGVEQTSSESSSGLFGRMAGFDDFVMPVGMPTIFEDPFITTDLRLLYIYHRIPGGSVLRGGQVHVAALQIRVALTDRLAFLATKDGYSWVDSGITSAGDGWNDIVVGFKYAFYVNQAEQVIWTGGLRWEWQNGSTDAWQGGGSGEINPGISFAKGWDEWHFIGDVQGRIPTNHHKGNASVTWNLHLDYALTETFRPLVEVHGIHWLSNADRLPISADYLDVGSLGASSARGRDFFSAGVGFRWEMMEDVSLGVTYEFPLESKSEHLQDYRFTMNTVIRF